MPGDRLPIEVGEFKAPIRHCWYCGDSSGPFEKEHQLPRSRGGRGRRTGTKAHQHTAIVWACEACNDVKGALDVEGYRTGLAARLGVEVESVVFYGEATAERSATPFHDVRSLLGSRAVVRIDPFVGVELDDAVSYMAAVGERTTKKDLASELLRTGLEGERAARFGRGTRKWPKAESLTLFALDEDENGRPQIFPGRSTLAHLPKVIQPRELTKIPGENLEAARQMVGWRQTHGETDLTLVEWMGQAVREKLARDSERLAEATPSTTGPSEPTVL